MARYRMETLNDLAKGKWWMLVRCRCGHERRFSPDALIVATKGMGLRTLDQIGERMRCDVCDRRDSKWSVCLAPDERDTPIGIDPAEWANARDDRERKRLIRQARG